MDNLVTTTNMTTQKLTLRSPGNIDTLLLVCGWITNHIVVLVQYIIYILQILNQIRKGITNLAYHKKLSRQMKPNILIILHYISTSTYSSFSTPNTNLGPGNQSLVWKKYDAAHHLHTHLNPHNNDKHLPLT